MKSARDYLIQKGNIVDNVPNVEARLIKNGGNMDIIKLAKEMIKLGKIEKDGENCWNVDEQIILRKTKDGHSYLTCSCPSCTYSNESLCSRKICVILYESQDIDFKHLIMKNLKLFESSKKLNIPLEVDVVINLLNDLRGFIVV